jgi:heme exporter protein C
MKRRWEHIAGVLGLLLLAYGSFRGLVQAPPDRFMGEVVRILYIHVPTAWAALLVFTLVFFVAVVYLFRPRWGLDAAMESGTEVGVLMGILLIFQGSAWARPTWGVWWDWDPRLTTSAVLVLGFGAILALRSFVDDPKKRATWTAVAAIVAYVDVPIVYYSVRWWRSLHQVQSTMGSVDSDIRVPLLINVTAVMLLTTWLVARRWRVAMNARKAELAELEAA